MAKGEVSVSSPEKILFKKAGITKQEMVDYYSFISKEYLKYSKSRLVALKRCPKGSGDTCFFQKHLDEDNPYKIPVIKVKEREGKSDLYPYISRKSDLLSLAQLNTIEFHNWGSSIEDLEEPLELILDLDPDDAVKESDVIRGAFIAKKLMEEYGLIPFSKMTGGKGIHVVAPLKKGVSWSEVKEVARKFSEALEAAYPEFFISTSSKKKRKGKIYVDYLRNERGSTSIALYSVRARENAPLSFPLDWSDLKGKRKLPKIFLKDAKRLPRGKWKTYFSSRRALPKLF